MENTKKKKKVILEERHESPDEQIRKSIGQKIRQVRDKRSQSADRVATKLHMSRVALTHIETGTNNINAVQLWKTACLLGCSIEEFFPPIPKGFALTKQDYEKIGREDEGAEKWAKDLFSDEI